MRFESNGSYATEPHDVGTLPESPSHERPSIPSGTVTFVFTDIEGSTVRWDRDRAAMQDAVRRHDVIMRASIAAHEGHVFKTIGDAFCAAFSRPEDAVCAMLDAQRALATDHFTAVDGIHVRVAIHTGTADERDDDYFGPAVNRVARLLAIAHGGQVLLSGVTSDLVHGSLPPQASLRDLGEHRLKDLARPEHVHQLQAPELGAEFPPLRSLNTLSNNLPLQVTSFIGRDVEIAEVTALLEQHRLVTLVGAGGVGKTRASLQVAANAVDGIADGVWFIELAPLSSGEYIPATIAEAIGLELGDGDPIAQLVAALKSKRMLIVFDNCEHLIDAAARVVAALLRGCSQVAILATSRQALGVSGEATYQMPALAVPALTTAGTSATMLTEEAMRFAAVALFVDRARAVNDRFELTAENASTVADICRRLDGIALAIELAAARVKMLSPQQLRDRLDERFRVLTSGSRDVLPRQQTLRALIDWSYDLLDEREQMFFRRLGIFVNGFLLEAASAVGGAGEFDEFEVFDLVASLAEKSLVMTEPRGSVIRYRLLESTRAYALEKLDETDERDLIAGRHLRYFRDWLTHIEREALEFRASRARAFAEERDNIRFALDGALSRGELADGAELLAATGNAWILAGFQREGIARIESCIASLPPSAYSILARLGTALATLYDPIEEAKKYEQAVAAAVRAARAANNGPLLALALRYESNVQMIARDLAAAEATLTEAEAIVGVSPAVQSDLLSCRAQLSMDTGDLDAAVRGFTQLRDLFRVHGNRPNEVTITSSLGEAEFRRGNYQHAADHWREDSAYLRNADTSIWLAESLIRLGSALIMNDEREAAIATAMETLALLERQDFGLGATSRAIELCAYLLAIQYDFERSARLAAYADAGLSRSDFMRRYVAQTIHDRLTTLLHGNLRPDVLAQLTADGAALTLEAAIGLARE